MLVVVPVVLPVVVPVVVPVLVPVSVLVLMRMSQDLNNNTTVINVVRRESCFSKNFSGNCIVVCWGE